VSNRNFNIFTIKQLNNPPLRQAAERYASAYQTKRKIEMKLKLLLLIPFFILSSCKKNVDLSKTEKKIEELKKVNESKSKNHLKSIPTSFSLDNFNESFDDINGPTCVFAETEKDYENKKFLFVSNFDSIGYISVNHKILRLELIERKYKAKTTENEDYLCVYKGMKYKVSLHITVDNTKEYNDESWWNKGELTIENDNGEKITKNFIGLSNI
jgi:hypothetical protein